MFKHVMADTRANGEPVNRTHQFALPQSVDVCFSKRWFRRRMACENASINGRAVGAVARFSSQQMRHAGRENRFSVPAQVTA